MAHQNLRCLKIQLFASLVVKELRRRVLSSLWKYTYHQLEEWSCRVGRPTKLSNGRTRFYCACSRCGWGLFGNFPFVCYISSFSLSLPRKSVVRLTDRPNMTLDVYRGRKTTMQQQQIFLPFSPWETARYGQKAVKT